jgi:hypothetical protein
VQHQTPDEEGTPHKEYSFLPHSRRRHQDQPMRLVYLNTMYPVSFEKGWNTVRPVAEDNEEDEFAFHNHSGLSTHN